uniref:Uncharacterized protein n=1 Tax=Arundo donax TaxID=35708 RepID=A0A0A9PY94_ARUDO
MKRLPSIHIHTVPQPS